MMPAFFVLFFLVGGGGGHNPGKEVCHFFKFAISQLHLDSQIDLVVNPAKQLNLPSSKFFK